MKKDFTTRIVTAPLCLAALGTSPANGGGKKMRGINRFPLPHAGEVARTDRLQEYSKGKSKLQFAVFGVALAIVLCLPFAKTARAEQFGFGTFPQQTGEAIYKGVCQGCHMPDAKGAVGAGAYPALADNPKLQDAGYPVYLVVNGHKAMPPFGDGLGNVQVANVVNYIRTHFGNRYTDVVKPSDVQIVRPVAAIKNAPKNNMHN